MPNKHRPEGCTDLVGLRFLNPEYGEWDYQSTLDVNAEDFPVYTVAPELLNLLTRILGASESKNNGAYMGEAVLCKAFEEEAHELIKQAKGE